MPADPRAYFMREYVEPGILDAAEIAGGMHCMAPRFLSDQLERSRRNLQLETIDVYYVHNPESQLAYVPPVTFQKRLTAAFGALEEAVRAGKLRWYGVATWNAFRVPSGEPGYVPLEAVLDAARAAGGEEHHFRFIQLPFNLAMSQPWSKENHKLDGESVSALEFARRRGMAAIGSATLHQGQLTADLPEFIGKRLGMSSNAANAIQFARSAPGLVTALIGMSRKEHVAVNLTVTSYLPAKLEEWKQLFSR
jgi:aryl-alcohol dehydrogenase-like predicted oxidoreductase